MSFRAQERSSDDPQEALVRGREVRVTARGRRHRWEIGRLDVGWSCEVGRVTLAVKEVCGEGYVRKKCIRELTQSHSEDVATLQPDSRLSG